MKDTLIIIPAYNEEKNIAPVLASLNETEISSFADVLVINDASKDATAPLVRSLMDKGYNVILQDQVFNMGYGTALQVGYKYAVRRHYKYVIQMDADGQHDPCNVPVIYKALTTPDADGNTSDIILGARFMDGSGEYKTSRVKKFAYSLFRAMIKSITGVHISDPTTGLQGLSRRAFIYYSMYNKFDDKYPDANMITQMLMLGFRVKEIPAVMHYRTSGVSMHSGLKPIIYMIRMVLSITAVYFRVKFIYGKNEGADSVTWPT